MGLSILSTKILAVDTETTGLRPDKGDFPFMFSFTSYEGEDLVITFSVDPFKRRVMYDNRLKIVKEILSKDRIYLLHNAPFDVSMFQALGIKLGGRIIDTLLLADAADNSRSSYALKPLSTAIFGDKNEDETDLHTATRKARAGAKKLGFKIAKDLKADYWLAPTEICEKYAIRDTQRTMRLFQYYESIAKTNPIELAYSPLKNFKSVSSFEHSLMTPTIEMNSRGVKVIPEKIEELKVYYKDIIERNKAKIIELGYKDLNPKSPKQKSEIFYDNLGMKEVLRRRKKPDGTSIETRSADKKALAQWRFTNPLAFALIELMEADKQLTGFLNNLEEVMVDENDYKVVHPSFNIVGAHATGRMSCSSPNLQNITTETSPNRISDIDFRLREVFGPRPGYVWLLADFEQIEVINTAYLSKDRLMIDTIESGLSIHDVTCESLFSSRSDYLINKKKYRKLAKIATFAIFYGTGVKQLAIQLGITDEEANEIWHKFWDTYRGINKYNKDLAKIMKDTGYIEDMFGRTYRCPLEASYRAFNRMVQGTSAGMLKRAFLGVYEALRGIPDASIVMAIHDELVIEFKAGTDTNKLANLVKTSMQQDFHLKLKKPSPLGVSISLATENWNKKTELTLI